MIIYHIATTAEHVLLTVFTLGAAAVGTALREWALQNTMLLLVTRRQISSRWLSHWGSLVSKNAAKRR